MARYSSALGYFVEPGRALQKLVRPDAPFERRLTWDAHPYPQYAYSLHKAAVLAQRLGVPEISAVEFGVAGGRGLVQLEQHARDVTALTQVKVRVFGMDSGGGLPPASTNKDLPYIWRAGQFQMDHDALRARLQSAQLLLGDVGDTVPKLIEAVEGAPVGFVSFDLDYYSSTARALELFDASDDRLLPRVFCYFDDLIGADDELHCEFAGEQLAINEFNAAHAERKLGQIQGLRWKRRVPAVWNDTTFVLHCFEHPQYSQYIGLDDWQIPLDGD
jgi:hypothetical protein